MNGFELNKIAAAVLTAGLIAMVVGIVGDALYKPELHPKVRGYHVAVQASTGASTPAPVEELFKVGQLMALADPKLGQDHFKKCAMCHSNDKAGHNKVGPNLWNVVKSKKAQHSEYNYSSAMRSKGGNWEYDELFYFLKSPKKAIPGTRMGFAGFNKPQDIANIIAYLRTLSDAPQPLPEVEK